MLTQINTFTEDMLFACSGVGLQISLIETAMFACICGCLEILCRC